VEHALPVLVLERWPRFAPPIRHQVDEFQMPVGRAIAADAGLLLGGSVVTAVKRTSAPSSGPARDERGSSGSSKDMVRAS
jgi:hypothetical protein